MNLVRKLRKEKRLKDVVVQLEDLEKRLWELKGEVQLLQLSNVALLTLIRLLEDKGVISREEMLKMSEKIKEESSDSLDKDKEGGES